jgi:hypothetical protein
MSNVYKLWSSEARRREVGNVGDQERALLRICFDPGKDEYMQGKRLITDQPASRLCARPSLFEYHTA